MQLNLSGQITVLSLYCRHCHTSLHLSGKSDSILVDGHLFCTTLHANHDVILLPPEVFDPHKYCCDNWHIRGAVWFDELSDSEKQEYLARLYGAIAFVRPLIKNEPTGPIKLRLDVWPFSQEWEPMLGGQIRGSNYGAIKIKRIKALEFMARQLYNAKHLPSLSAIDVTWISEQIGLPIKTTFNLLEAAQILPIGTWDKVTDSGHTPAKLKTSLAGNDRQYIIDAAPELGPLKPINP